MFLGNFKGLCFHQEHLEKKTNNSSNNNKKELVHSNRKLKYQGNTNVVLDEYRMLDKELAGRKKETLRKNKNFKGLYCFYQEHLEGRQK